jgi:hypothetical protein
VEQFVLLFIKIQQISSLKSALEARRKPFSPNRRILFGYTDNAPELCGIKL